MAHILIVEDEQSINDPISMNLELVGHSSEQVFDGNEVLVCLKQNSYSLIIMDIMLPGLDGFNLIPHVDQGTPVIFLYFFQNGYDGSLDKTINKQKNMQK